jgi:hypothetical protein
MKVMSNPGHRNVIRLFGVHTQSEPLAIIMVCCVYCCCCSGRSVCSQD